MRLQEHFDDVRWFERKKEAHETESVETVSLNEIELKGCSPVPLAHYLKALGLMKIISTQFDRNALGYWKNDSFYFRTNKTEK